MPLRIVGAAIVGLLIGLYWHSEVTQPIETREIVDPTSGTHRLVIRADSDSQCYIEATVTGDKKPVRFRFLMDSGAAGNMALTQRDARYLGFDTARLNYSDSYQAWGSVGYQANVTLREVRVNSLVLRNVKASVAQATSSDEVSLLGANFLRMLNFQIRTGSCVVTVPSRGKT